MSTSHEPSGTSLRKLIDERKLIVCVGPGGVGKTTVSAAIALAAAKRGRKTAVITVDPARRLADALGLPELSDDLCPVDLGRIAADQPITGTLHAAMVDTSASIEGVMRRVAPDEATLARIMNNRVFQVASRSLARSHAYVAMERLYDATSSGDYDLVVLDTPPARNALDVLDAPSALARFLDARVIGFFLPEHLDKPSLTGRVFSGGGRMAKHMLGRLTGQALLDEILGIIELFAELREGFAARATHVDRLLRAPTTSFVLITSGSATSADDAAWMREDLERRNVPIEAVVFNQSYVPLDPDDPHRIVADVPACDLKAAVGKLRPHLPADVSGLEQWVELLRGERARAAEDNRSYQRVVDGVIAELPASCTCVRMPRFAREIHDLPALMKLVGDLLAK